MKIGPIPSALMVQKLIGKNSPHPVHTKTVNALLVNVVASAAHLPTPIALQTFSSLAVAHHPVATRVLSSIQDRWFEAWNSATVAKGTRRPKIKQDYVGLYSEDAADGVRIKSSSLVRNLDDAVLNEAIRALVETVKIGTNVGQVKLITNSLVNEYSRRMSGRETEIPLEIQEFITLVTNR